MRYKAKSTTLNDFGGLFNDCSTGCAAFSACGGDVTAPCGCTWPVESGRRHKCDTCYLVCRELEEIDSNNNLRFGFDKHIASGKFLNELLLSQNSISTFPLFIPTFTNVFKDGELPLKWIAADLNRLFNAKGLRKKFSTENTSNAYLNASTNTTLLAVLNGKDKYLENLWEMGEHNRRRIFEHLLDIGFTIGTGPTYSVSTLTDLNTPVPQAHNVAMLTRHHKIVDELNSTGFYTAPNLYWRDNYKRELYRWVNWLITNPEIQTITRDFTSTRHPTTVLSKLQELLELLDLTGRKFHVLIVGTGTSCAPTVLKLLAENGHTGSIISCAPIYDARIAALRYRIENGTVVKEKDYRSSYSSLIINNLEVFEKALGTVIYNSPYPYSFLQNFQY